MSEQTLSLLGSFTLTLDDQTIDRFRTNRAQALLIYLAVEAGRGERVKRREQLVELLWPGMPASSGLQNLRQTLYQLRKQISDLNDTPFLIANRQTIQLNADYPLTVDTTEFESLLAQHPDHWMDAVDLYRGDFLSDFYLPDAATFELWAAERRADYQRQALDALTSLTDMQIERRAYEEAERLARRQLHIDSLREKGHQQLMLTLAYAGRRAEALRQFEICQAILEGELAVPVSQTTAQLAATIQAEQLPTFGRTQTDLGAYNLKEMIGSGNFGSV